MVQLKMSPCNLHAKNSIHHSTVNTLLVCICMCVCACMHACIYIYLHGKDFYRIAPFSAGWRAAT